MRVESLVKSVLTQSKDTKELLEISGLSKAEILDQLGSIARLGDSGQVRLRALETALKLHGELTKEGEAGNIPSITINICDSQHAIVNPILIPRT